MINTLNIVLGLVAKQQLREAGEKTVPQKCEVLQHELYLTGKITENLVCFLCCVTLHIRHRGEAVSLMFCFV